MSELRWILLGLAIIVFLGTVIWSRYSKSNKGRNLFDSFDNNSLEKDVLYANDPLEIEQDFGVSEVRIIKPSVIDSGAQSSARSYVDSSTNSDSELSSASYTQNLHNENQADHAYESEDGISGESEAPDNTEDSTDDSQHIIVLHVTARPGDSFKGKKLCRTLEHFGLKHGKYKIYHRESLQNPDVSLFSVANMVKPGYFDTEAVESLTTPGISFFLVLPGPHDPITTFNEMVQTARQVSQQMDGEVLDADRSTFSMQRAQLIREEIVSFMHRIQDE